MTADKNATARRFIGADLDDAARLIEDAEKLLPEAGLPDSPKLTAELEAARSATRTALGTFLALARQGRP